jgi:hypothetical protein
MIRPTYWVYYDYMTADLADPFDFLDPTPDLFDMLDDLAGEDYIVRVIRDGKRILTSFRVGEILAVVDIYGVPGLRGVRHEFLICRRKRVWPDLQNTRLRADKLDGVRLEQ